MCSRKVLLSKALLDSMCLGDSYYPIYGMIIIHLTNIRVEPIMVNQITDMDV